MLRIEERETQNKKKERRVTKRNNRDCLILLGLVELLFLLLLLLQLRLLLFPFSSFSLRIRARLWKTRKNSSRRGEETKGKKERREKTRKENQEQIKERKKRTHMRKLVSGNEYGKASVVSVKTHTHTHFYRFRRHDDHGIEV